MPELTGRSIASIKDAWLVANRWWLADDTKLRITRAQIVSVMQSRRGYHSISHIERMLLKYSEWCGVTVTTPDPRLITWIFAHDLVYAPGAPDNEEASATEMDRLLEKMGAQRRIQRDDRTAIESTKSHLPIDPTLLDEPKLAEAIDLLHDLDLEILGSSRRDYEAYRGAVYAEYLAAADPSTFHGLWLQGRRAFLEEMLQRERLFKTPLFAMFDQHARDNMRSELENIIRVQSP